MDTTNMLGKNMRFLRQYWHLSRPALARAIGLKSPRNIQRWENGESEPRFGEFAAMAKVFRVNMDAFYQVDLEALHRNHPEWFDQSAREVTAVCEFIAQYSVAETE